MEGYSGKRGASRIIAPQKGYIAGFKNASTNTDDQNALFCNRIGCSGRIKYSQSGDSETRELISSPNRNFTRHRLGSKNKTGEVAMIAKNGSSSSPSNIRPRKAFHHKSESNNQNNTQLASSSFVPSNSKSSSLRTLSSSSSNTSNRYGKRNLKCDSTSISKSKSAGKNVMKKKNPETERSLSRRGPQNGHLCPLSSGISISDSGRSHSASGDSKNAGSVRTRNVNNGRARLSYQQNARNSSRVSRFSDSLRVNVGGPQFTVSGFLRGSSSYNLSSSNPHGQSTIMPFTAGEQYNMDGITEVLLAIERFEQDEDLTHEQVLALETNLLVSGLNLYDQHRDMRLDIDNMSYEELLALEEKMGSVSTALSEEALLKCIKRGKYDAGPSKVRATGSGEDGDDIKCSICQEEYAVGDETGKLVECQHGYHLMCINQWLRLKNWCPVCKAAVAPQE